MKVLLAYKHALTHAPVARQPFLKSLSDLYTSIHKLILLHAVCLCVKIITLCSEKAETGTGADTGGGSDVGVEQMQAGWGRCRGVGAEAGGGVDAGGENGHINEVPFQ